MAMQIQKVSKSQQNTIGTYFVTQLYSVTFNGDIPLCWDNRLSIWPELWAKSYGKEKEHQIFGSRIWGIKTIFKVFKVGQEHGCFMGLHINRAVRSLCVITELALKFCHTERILHNLRNIYIYLIYNREKAALLPSSEVIVSHCFPFETMTTGRISLRQRVLDLYWGSQTIPLHCRPTQFHPAARDPHSLRQAKFSQGRDQLQRARQALLPRAAPLRSAASTAFSFVRPLSRAGVVWHETQFNTPWLFLNTFKNCSSASRDRSKRKDDATFRGRQQICRQGRATLIVVKCSNHFPLMDAARIEHTIFKCYICTHHQTLT